MLCKSFYLSNYSSRESIILAISISTITIGKDLQNLFLNAVQPKYYWSATLSLSKNLNFPRFVKHNSQGLNLFVTTQRKFYEVSVLVSLGHSYKGPTTLICSISSKSRKILLSHHSPNLPLQRSRMCLYAMMLPWNPVYFFSPNPFQICSEIIEVIWLAFET